MPESKAKIAAEEAQPVLDAHIAERIARVRAHVAAHPEKYHEDGTPRDLAAKLPTPPAKIIQLPIWPEPVRATPNSFLRSALFAAIQGKGRRQMKNELLAAMQGVTVRYTGEQLDQSDLDVWEQAYHLARSHPLGNVCHFTAYGFLKALGRSTGNAQYQWLESVFLRLTACAVVIESNRKQYGGNLIGSWKQDKDSRTFKLILNPETVKLYSWNDWTAVDWEQRQTLRGKPLALWLHGFYSSHARAHPVKVETLRQLSGSGTKNPRHFKANLKAALADLEAATGISGTIEGDLVTVERHGTRCQQRHLSRREGHQKWTRKAQRAKQLREII